MAILRKSYKNMNLSDNKKRYAVKMIQAGQPLPKKFRFLLFDDG